MGPNSFVAGTNHFSYLYFIDQEEGAVHFHGRSHVEVAGGSAAYQNSNASVTCSASKHLPMLTTLQDRLRVSHRRYPSSIYVEFLRKATHLRSLRQAPSFMFPQPRRAGDPVAPIAEGSWDTMGLRIGSTECAPCENRPTHQLDPCGHTVCYEHYLHHPEDLPVRCAKCLKVSLLLHDLPLTISLPLSTAHSLLLRVARVFTVTRG
jgi:hypothetical protein